MNQKPHPIRIILSIMLALLLLLYSYTLISMVVKYGIAKTHELHRQPLSEIFAAVIVILTIIALLLPYNKRYNPVITNPWPISILSTAFIASPVFLYVIFQFNAASIYLAVFGFVLALNLRYGGCKNKTAYRLPLVTALAVATLPELAYIIILILIITGHARVG